MDGAGEPPWGPLADRIRYNAGQDVDMHGYGIV